MKKSVISLAMFAALVAASLPANAVCSFNSCETCDKIFTTAGVVNYDKASTRTNFGVIAKEKQLNEFERLVKKAGMKHKIDKGNYTVFAPTNEAIHKMGKSRIDYLKKDENRDELVKFVLAHMAPGNQSAGCLCQEQMVTNLNCCDIGIEKCCNRLAIGNAQVLAPDINTKNGKVHVIDEVLMPYS